VQLTFKKTNYDKQDNFHMSAYNMTHCVPLVVAVQPAEKQCIIASSKYDKWVFSLLYFT